MTFVRSRCQYIFMKYRVEQTSRAFSIRPRRELHPRNELNDNSANISPVKMAYTCHESMPGNEPSATAADACPVIIMHGLFGSKSNWNPFSEELNRISGRKVITTDARNHGDSPHSSESSYIHMAADVAFLLKDIGNDKAVVMGHSLGGRALMYLALNKPELVEKLVVVDISPVSSSPRLKPIATFFDAMENVTIDENVSLSEARSMADQQLSTVIRTTAIRENLLQNLVEEKPGKYKWRINLPVLKKHFDSFCGFPHITDKTFNGPSLFIGGSQSDHLPPNDHEKIKELFPAAKFGYISKAGHWPHVQQPQEMLKTIVSFINGTN